MDDLAQEPWLWGVVADQAYFLPEAWAAGHDEADDEVADPDDEADEANEEWNEATPRINTLMWDALAGLVEELPVGRWNDELGGVPHVLFSPAEAPVVIAALTSKGIMCIRDDARFDRAVAAD